MDREEEIYQDLNIPEDMCADCYVDPAVNIGDDFCA